MKRHMLVACALAALVACGQAEAPKEEAPPAPQSLFEEVQAQPREQQLITAYQHLIAYQQSHPETTPPCQNVRETASRGIIPENVSPDSIYASYQGAAVYSVQCGELLSRAPMDPNEHWLVVYAPGASEVSVVNCAGERGRDRCPFRVPTVEVETGGASTTPTAP